MNRHRHREYRAIMTGVVGVCGLGFTSAVWPAVEHAAGVALAVLAVAALAVLGLRWGYRRLREYREDQADTAYAAAMRDAHAHAHDRATAGAHTAQSRPGGAR